jgi:hypothetical protein
MLGYLFQIQVVALSIGKFSTFTVCSAEFFRRATRVVREYHAVQPGSVQATGGAAARDCGSKECLLIRFLVMLGTQ